MQNLSFGLLKARLVRSLDRRCRRWLGPVDLNECVGRESQRVRRTGGEFSVVIFGVESLQRAQGANAIRRFTRLLDKRARQTDLLGWLDSNLLCAVLPSTGTEGASHFVEDVLGLFIKSGPSVSEHIETRAPQPAFRVHTYPSMWFIDAFDESMLIGSPAPESSRRPHSRAGRIVSVGFGAPDDQQLTAEGLKAL